MEDSVVAQPISPKSPPGSLDLYGKRRQMVKVQALEREILQLLEELKSVEHFQPASRYCKEVDDFVGAKPDPLLSRIPKVHKSHSLWNCFCGNCCSNSSSICCSRTSRLQIKSCSIFPNCTSCNSACVSLGSFCSSKTCRVECCCCKRDSCLCRVRSIFQNCTKKSCSSCTKTCCQ